LESSCEFGNETSRSITYTETNFKMDLVAIEWDGVDWSWLAQDRDKWRALVNAVMNRRVP
jgi:hypothetical protein